MDDFDLYNEIYEANKKIDKQYKEEKNSTNLSSTNHFAIYISAVILSLVVVICVVLLLNKILKGASELSGNSTEETVNSTQFEISTLEPWKIDFSNTCTINSFDYEANGSFNFYESSADYEQVKKYTSQIGRLDVPDVYTSTIENGYSWIYDPADGVDSFVITSYDTTTEEFMDTFCKNNIHSNNYSTGYINNYPILCWQDGDLLYAFIFADSSTVNHVLVGARCHLADQALINLLNSFEPF